MVSAFVPKVEEGAEWLRCGFPHGKILEGSPRAADARLVLGGVIIRRSRYAEVTY